MCLNQQSDNDKVGWKYVYVGLLLADCYFMLLLYVLLVTCTDYRPVYYTSK
jgi:hypothetical protein